jgi:D-alanyl-D-alanine endopeptidase (penicillin-binding protein 7)
MVSSNDAGEALAQNDPKGRADFIRSMNEWVQSIGAYHTYFADPTGLSPENVSDAGDLAIIIRWIYLNRPDLIAITDTKVKEFRIHTWTNPTQLLNLSSYLGGKNGYIPQSGETAVSLFQVGSKLFAVVVLGSSDRDQDILELMREATGVAYITYEDTNTSGTN